MRHNDKEAGFTLLEFVISIGGFFLGLAGVLVCGYIAWLVIQALQKYIEG